jgi:hypothetical protein
MATLMKLSLARLDLRGKRVTAAGQVDILLPEDVIVAT